MSDREQQFATLIASMLDVFIAKNKDYGNSFDITLDEEGIVAARVRMKDKMNRFNQLSKVNKNEVKDESIQDTLLDLANYAVMTIMWLNKVKK